VLLLERRTIRWKYYLPFSAALFFISLSIKCIDVDDVYRVSFNVDYRNRRGDPSKKVGKDEIPTLESALKAAEDSLSEIAKEIDFARRQEVLLRDAGGVQSI
jgi:2-phosphoglycerate kinase